MAADPDLSITIEIKNQDSQLVFSDVQVRGVPFRGRVYRGARDQRLVLHRALQRIVSEIGADATDASPGLVRRTIERIAAIRRYRARRHWARVTQAVRWLYERGQSLNEDLFGDEVHEAQTIFERACPFWDKAEPATLTHVPLIEIKGHLADAPPIEFLPLLAPEKQPPANIENITELTNALRPFVGFSALIKRTLDDRSQSQISELPGTPMLPVKFFRNMTLRYAGRELANLQRERRIAVDSWPDAAALQRPDFACHVAHNLWIHDGARFDGSLSGAPFQVMHFACHCTTEGEADNYALMFGETGDTSTRVSLDQLKACRQQNGKQIRAYRDAAHPLVFMNACDSSVMDPTAVTSFPDFFLSRGSCAYIGTEAPVPDALAELISDAFYTELLTGASIGAALYRAKWHLAQVHNNPLGLLYMLYGNPDVTLKS
jgi:hypothetical protein